MIEIEKLRAALSAATPTTPRPWFAPERGNREWLYEDSALTSGESPRISATNPGRVLAKMNTNSPYRADLELICSAVNAAPDLLVIYEAVEKWRDARCDVLPFCEYGDHELECAVRQRENDLVHAIDAARKKVT